MKQPVPFGKYFLLDRVNVGGMAEVFRAKATGVEGFERLVAVKRILPSIAADEDFITMFIDEAKIAVQLTHANIAQIFDLGKVGDSYFIALEYIPGMDVRAIFTRARQRKELLPLSMACYVIMKVCEGLEYAHQKRDATGQFLNLVHRDVSPQNLLVSYEGAVKVIDFGIAKAVGKQGMTQAGMLKGKFGYMSPEQVEGVPIDRRSDIFGLGICLYELLTGERLFVAETDFATLEKVRAGDIMPPSTYNRQIPEALEQIVLRALARDREHRHQTAMELHDDLQAFLYATGNLFGRKELSTFMHAMFATEIEQERMRDQMYADMDFPDLDAADEANLADLEVVPVGEADLSMSAAGVGAGGAIRAAPVHAETLPPPAGPGHVQPGHVQPGHMQGQVNEPAKATLLGVAPAEVVASGSSPSAAPAVPRPIPTAASIPPSNRQADSNPKLGVQWDDEELSTQIYDRPDEVEDLTAEALADLESVPQGAPGAPVPVATPAQAQAPAVVAPAPAVSGHPGPIVTAPLQQSSLPPSSMYPGGGGEQRQRRSLVGGVLAVVVILGLIVGALLLFQPPDPAVIHVSTVPADAAVKVDGVLVAGTSPFVLQELEPERPHQIEIGRDGYLPWSGTVTLQPGQTMALPLVSLKQALGGFAVDSVPSGAAVLVDGRPTGKTTPARLTEVPVGPHRVELQLPGQPPLALPMVNVQPGVVTELPAATLAEVADTASPPDARSASETRTRPRRTPRARGRAVDEPVAPAPRRPVVLMKDDPDTMGGSEGQTDPGTDTGDPATEASDTGTLRVNSRPWSVVFVDGRRVGNTPQRSLELSAGTHRLEFVNEEFGLRKTVTVEVKAGETLTKVVALEP